MADLTHSASTVKVNANHLQPSGKAKPLERAVHQLLAFLIGALIPFISWRTELGGAAATFSERVAIVDVVALILIFLFILKGIKFTLSAVLYGLCLLASLFIANFSATTDSEWSRVVVSAVALMVAFGYWIVGYNIAFSRTLTRYLIVGLACSLLIETIIVAHDILAPQQIFADPMLGRARGTFRASGQLGAYGYSIAAITFIVAYNWSKIPLVRLVTFFLGLAGVFVIVASSRRLSMISIVIFIIIYLAVSVFHLRFRHFLIIIITSIVAYGIIGAHFDQFASGFTGQRLIEALEILETGENFTFSQFEIVIDNVSEWFPFGVGVGRWWINYDSYELHNAHLAILVEIGWIGLILFYWLMLLPIRLNRNISPLIKYAIISFIITSSVMMIHNTLHRDRTFMLALGILTNYAVFSRSQDINTE